MAGSIMLKEVDLLNLGFRNLTFAKYLSTRVQSQEKTAITEIFIELKNYLLLAS